MALKQILFQFLRECPYWLCTESQISWQTVPKLFRPRSFVSQGFVPVTARQPDSADRRCRRLAIDVTGTQSTARYGGASPCRHLQHRQLVHDALTLSLLQDYCIQLRTLVVSEPDDLSSSLIILYRLTASASAGVCFHKMVLSAAAADSDNGRLMSLLHIYWIILYRSQNITKRSSVPKIISRLHTILTSKKQQSTYSLHRPQGQCWWRHGSSHSGSRRRHKHDICPRQR